jgi:hypothetical protein
MKRPPIRPPPPVLEVVDPPRRGRPPGSIRVTESHTAVMCWIPASLHDQLIALANREEQSISATIRALLVLKLR